MKIERLTDNKIRIIVNPEDLKENNIDSNSLMEKPIETQELFMEMLSKAEKELGFYTDGYRILVEAFSSSDGYFVFTITKYLDNQQPRPKKPKVKAKTNPQILKKIEAFSIYKFNTFEDFCSFCEHISKKGNINFRKLAKNISLYIYEENYFLVLSDVNVDYEYLKVFNSTVSEFGKLVSHSHLLKSKLIEHGKIVMRNNAIVTGIKYFCKTN